MSASYASVETMAPQGGAQAGVSRMRFGRCVCVVREVLGMAHATHATVSGLATPSGTLRSRGVSFTGSLSEMTVAQIVRIARL